MINPLAVGFASRNTMKIVNRNPEILTLSWLMGRFMGRFASRATSPEAPFDAAFIVKATLSLADDGRLVPREEGPLQPEGDRPMPGEAPLGLAYASDFVPVKPRAEYTVVGTAHRPATSPANRFHAAVEVAGIRKELVICGPRPWEPTLFSYRAGRPGYVDREPLTYAAALGGPDDDANPIGIGRALPHAPRIEAEGRPVTSPHSEEAPAGFGPLERRWEQRRTALGNFGSGWIKDRWPWLPDGLDSEVFMAAPPDQRLSGFLRGDESIAFENILPDRPMVRTKLPGVRARLFVLRKIGPRLHDPEGEFTEVPLVLDTLWADLDSRVVVLVWRGITAVQSIALRDIAKVLLFTEPLDATDHPPFHYRALLDEGVEPEALPDAAARAEARKKAKAEAEAMKAEIKESIRAGMTYPPDHRKELAAFAADVKDKSSLLKDGTSLPDLSPALAAYDDKVAKVEAARDQILALKRPTKSKVEAILAAASGPSEDPATPEALRRQLSEMLDQVKGLPNLASDHQAKLESAVQQTIAKQEELLAFRERLDSELAANSAKIDAALPAWALREPADPDQPVDPEAARREGFAHQNLTEFDFSGLDLAGVDFRHAIVVDALFVGTNLTGADFTAADLTGADFSRADLSFANLAGADLTSATLIGARLAGANLAGAKLSDLDLAGLDLSGIDAPQADFARANLERASLEQARLERANFSEATLTGARFLGAKLANASLAGAHAAGADFSTADLTAMRSGQGADFTDAIFRLAKAEGSVWSDSIVDRADFSGAMLDRANFTFAFCRGTRFFRCHLTDATLDDAVLVGAILSQSRLFRASLSRADLTRARCDGTNMFSASLWSAVLVDTDLRGANLGRAVMNGVVQEVATAQGQP